MAVVVVAVVAVVMVTSLSSLSSCAAIRGNDIWVVLVLGYHFVSYHSLQTMVVVGWIAPLTWTTIIKVSVPQEITPLSL